MSSRLDLGGRVGVWVAGEPNAEEKFIGVCEERLAPSFYEVMKIISVIQTEI